MVLYSISKYYVDWIGRSTCVGPLDWALQESNVFISTRERISWETDAILLCNIFFIFYSIHSTTIVQFDTKISKNGMK